MTTSQIMVNKEDLLISDTELARFDATGDAFVEENTAHVPDYLNPTHKHYSEELAAAIEVWIQLYGEGQIKKTRGHIDQIMGALEGKGFNKSQKERIATMINSNKGGGAPKTGE